MKLMTSRPARVAAFLLLALLAASPACSSSPSTSASPPADAGTDTSTSLDAAPDTSMPEASSDTGGATGETGTPDGATDPCGPLTTTWMRCNADPLAKAGLLHSDGNYEVSIGDPDVQLDPSDHLWKAWWSTTRIGSATRK